MKRSRRQRRTSGNCSPSLSASACCAMPLAISARPISFVRARPSRAPRSVSPPELPSMTKTQHRLTHQQLAGSLIVAVLTHHKAEIDGDKLSWLRGFLRQHLSRAEYRIIAGVMGWSRPRRQSTDAVVTLDPTSCAGRRLYRPPGRRKKTQDVETGRPAARGKRACGALRK